MDKEPTTMAEKWLMFKKAGDAVKPLGPTAEEVCKVMFYSGALSALQVAVWFRHKENPGVAPKELLALYDETEEFLASKMNEGFTQN